ncbi:MAG: M28 family peptidase [Solirubrobacteraceae bacterium]
MRPRETITALAAFEGRGPGTDAERRAAQWLARELVADRQRVRIETFWCRPNWALAHAWHVALALIGSLLSVSHPTIGVVLLTVALVSTVADEVAGTSLGRRLTPERASQNVIATARSSGSRSGSGSGSGPGPDPPARLIVTANYDAGRTGLIYRDPVRATAARLRRATGGVAPGWLAWLVLASAYELAIAIVRLTAHHHPHALGVLQLPPAVALVLALALLLDAAGAGYGPGAGDNAAGTAVAIELARTLAAAGASGAAGAGADPGRTATVELVLQGAGQDEQIGLRRYLRTRKRELRQANVAVLGIAACGAGHPAWWSSDGRLVPLRYGRSLRTLAQQTSATAHRGRGTTPALPARATGLPAIAIGCLDDRGLAPRSHQRADSPEQIDDVALNRAITLGLTLIAALGSRSD